MTELSPEDARAFLVGHMGLRAIVHPTGAEGVRALLSERRCIQLDPLDPIGTNADLVAMARLDGVAKGDVYSALLPGHAFEHYSKELCLIPADRFTTWREGARAKPWWRTTEKMRTLSPDVLDAVEREITERGPIAVSDLTHRGRTEPSDWSGWKGTPKLATLAVQVLWRQCRIVICGRAGRGKVVDIPDRSLPAATQAPEPFHHSVLLNRVHAAGLLAENTGPHWSMLHDVRKSQQVEDLVRSGVLERVQITGARRTYLATAGFRDTQFPDDDGRMRILGPLDPLIWDRKLVRHVFDFEYIWEVYKPAAKRRWGWYVVPLLHNGHLVARMEARFKEGELTVENLWKEPDMPFDETAYATCLSRHQALLRAPV